ncbi:MAG: DUF4347 domain-containing protein [bacterium]|nr:DUF4347 domain-containing protein [bacterium]
MISVGIYHPTNSPGKRDGDTFRKECEAWADHQPDARTYGVAGRGRRHTRTLIEDAFRGLHLAGHEIDHVALFSHGWAGALQLGYRMKDGTDSQLVSVLRRFAKPDVHVTLYACSTGHDRDRDDSEAVGPGSEGGFAWSVCNGLHPDAVVDSHYTAGHATWNPFVVRFESTLDRATHNTMGDWLVKPKSKLWKRWRLALRANDDSLRYMFPRMSRAQIHTYLDPPQGDETTRIRVSSLPERVKNQH